MHACCIEITAAFSPAKKGGFLDKVLVVDDDPDVRTLLEIVGRRAGFTVDSSPDGLDALEKLRNSEYLIMVLDLMMPRVNGYDVVQQLAA